jgi:ribose 5-phosphate isomerase B
MQRLRVCIGNDHGGFLLKQAISAYLDERGVDVIDVGSHSTEIVRYPHYAAQVCRAVLQGDADRGILICSTGIGMSIVANKFKGIRAALCYSTYQGQMTAAHNDSNVLCLGGRCIGDFEAIDVVRAWLDTNYEGGRHDISLGILEAIEKENFVS